MKRVGILSVIVAVLVGTGALLYIYSVPGAIPNGQTQTNSTSVLGSPGNLSYDCAKPAFASQFSCDQLPAGYQITAKLPVGPPAYCSEFMTQSACALLKQTFDNGVCDPNETVWTDPLDCGCSGALVGDPYTGRCGTPATLCQAAAVREG